MVGSTQLALRLLLIPFIPAAVNTDGSFGGKDGYTITFPCEKLLCFYIWQQPFKNNNFGIVSNAEIQQAKSDDGESKCTEEIKDLTAKNIGKHQCRQGQGALTTQQTQPRLNLTPGKTASLQCILLPVGTREQCTIGRRRQIILTWVNETMDEIREDSQHRINRTSLCDVTLTVAFQHPGDFKFRCNATAGNRTRTSKKLRVRVQALNRRGRGMDLNVPTTTQGIRRYQVGVIVAVLACVVLTAAVALIVVKRRRTADGQLPSEPNKESCHSSGADIVLPADEVIYADIILPRASDGQRVLVSDSTEYACIHLK